MPVFATSCWALKFVSARTCRSSASWETLPVSAEPWWLSVSYVTGITAPQHSRRRNNSLSSVSHSTCLAFCFSVCYYHTHLPWQRVLFRPQKSSYSLHRCCQPCASPSRPVPLHPSRSLRCLSSYARDAAVGRIHSTPWNCVLAELVNNAAAESQSCTWLQRSGVTPLGRL